MFADEASVSLGSVQLTTATGGGGRGFWLLELALDGGEFEADAVVVDDVDVSCLLLSFCCFALQLNTKHKKNFFF